MLELEGKELIHVERVREGCVMPTDKRRWQPCSFGTQSQANRVAIAGCHASKGWTRDRTYHTQASRLKLAKVRLDVAASLRQLWVGAALRCVSRKFAPPSLVCTPRFLARGSA